jgi:hypothetical protein
MVVGYHTRLDLGKLTLAHHRVRTIMTVAFRRTARVRRYRPRRSAKCGTCGDVPTART